MIEIAEKFFNIFILCCALEFIQNILGGAIRGLGLQAKALLTYSFSYYIIGAPLAYAFAFKIGSHKSFSKETEG